LGWAGLLIALIAGPLAAPARAEPDPAASSVNMGDRSWADRSYNDASEAIRLGHLAANQGFTASVKAFGQKLVTDDTKASLKLKELTDMKGIKLSLSGSKSDDHFKILNRLSGVAFDKRYLNLTIEALTSTVSSFRGEIENGSDPNLKAWASETLPLLDRQLKLAREIQAVAGKQ
jgi:putative membrane protein